MAKQAFVLITCNAGMEDSVESQLNQFQNVKEVSRVHGAFDLVAKIEGSTESEIKGSVARKIRGLTSVRSSLSLLIKPKKQQ